MFKINKPVGDPINSIETMIYGLAYSKTILERYAGDARHAVASLTLAAEVEGEAALLMNVARDIMDRDENSPAIEYSKYNAYEREVIFMVLQTKIRLLED